MRRRGTNHQVPITSNPASQHTCLTSSSCSSAAATPTEWQPTPATQVTLVLLSVGSQLLKSKSRE